jgi:hypothetical protein
MFVLHLIVAPQVRSGWQHNSSTKTRQVGQDNVFSYVYGSNPAATSATGRKWQKKVNLFRIFLEQPMFLKAHLSQ